MRIAWPGSEGPQVLLLYPVRICKKDSEKINEAVAYEFHYRVTCGTYKEEGATEKSCGCDPETLKSEGLEILIEDLVDL